MKLGKTISTQHKTATCLWYLCPGRSRPADGKTVHSMSSVEKGDTFHTTPPLVLEKTTPLLLSLPDDGPSCWVDVVVIVVEGSSDNLRSPSSRSGYKVISGVDVAVRFRVPASPLRHVFVCACRGRGCNSTKSGP